MISMDDRKQFLIHMYDQMFNDINTHILVVWQSVGVLVGAFAILALVEKQVVPIDIAATLIVLICAWLTAHLYDASYWYNRNLAIIVNIERQFLAQGDLANIHYYFGVHRPNKMITHLRIQFYLALGIAAIVLLSHALTRLGPSIICQPGDIEPLALLPYFTLVVSLAVVLFIRGHRNRSYAEFLKNSPGQLIDASRIQYGEGHGFPRPRSEASESTE